jgi:putative ABC transport system substrate-binding protein
LEVSSVSVRDAGDSERAVEAFARSPNGGLIVTPSAAVSVHRDLIITLAARYKLPAVYSARCFVTKAVPGRYESAGFPKGYG